ncbi:hypothetical protein [Pedococcus sp. 2YAF34]|uniref:hypothetical protein n=1 Tax=Pedococcus sp. 2YAF34 TaxID=3233032 RepID=UPI003F965F33
MPLRNQCPVCLWSVRAQDGVVVEHDRTLLGMVERCTGSAKPAPATAAAAR